MGIAQLQLQLAGMETWDLIFKLSKSVWEQNAPTILQDGEVLELFHAAFHCLLTQLTEGELVYWHWETFQLPFF